MGRHKYRKRELTVFDQDTVPGFAQTFGPGFAQCFTQNGEQLNQYEGSGLLDIAKNLTKKATVKLSGKAGRKLGESTADNFFRKISMQNPVSSTSRLSESQVEDFYQYPENSGDEIFKILYSAGKVKQKQTSQKDSEEHKRNNQRPKPMKGLTQQEINENLNRLMNM